ncbi:hypothetical protein A2631_00730 [Candidatus Daviesbacteria bacterium RIFCSPHIGHO2_01_FULL_44_29]|uniref:Uncharacterized protein n=1 Tax=Candidatus Daviesbacteria bacterium RIFCSPHIGHO2_02_FULL_43_12 TaxID=1797776 RepID=A0A1F5KHG4_9BACT|nr:MAG: hypothetical protein A2631_00730 [Candidatus Daviesbacteria bacterium RIFCSPHIGHO2_01_FULL_44_29]OGE39366.1 MAG: hypothetical protein A3E86_01585 [Candidatus Daviesbacteria bacterium RIFCSPHIGHO2_12_FULL_47_45]OGE40245.1 MAG: hypothetical protein A3D25_05195 [Candidatus Daviesbacteria bacterium RIFCSPHIGHO2_02_FULL_43_12]OGE69044.1 MAG: hypothetical protein A3B55_02275 [Candidatus Daviesbacteria bacterium RIFCSPLOWO2_01_FULL_43_15]
MNNYLIFDTYIDLSSPAKMGTKKEIKISEKRKYGLLQIYPDKSGRSYNQEVIPLPNVANTAKK